MKPAEEKLRGAFAFPLVLEQDNSRGVCVKDCRGDTVFYEDFSFPDEMGVAAVERMIEQSRATAHFLVEFSESKCPFTGMETEIRASKRLFADTEGAKTWNEAMDKCLRICDRYRQGNGLFQL